MAEGLSAAEVGKGIGEHKQDAAQPPPKDRRGHCPLRQARYALIGVGALILAFAVVQLLGLPGPP
jgi:predicted anti-sigma-YlaC factor YlaD